jgi:hypothetical protein
MKRKFVVFIFVFLFILSGATAAYSHCAQAASHIDFGAEHHDVPSVNCPDVFLNTSIQVKSGIRLYADNLWKLLPSLPLTGANIVAASWPNNHSLPKPFSRQSLYRFEEVYRL